MGPGSWGTCWYHRLRCFIYFFISNCFSKLQLLGSHAQARHKGFPSTPIPSLRTTGRRFIASTLAQRGTDRLGKLEKQHLHCPAPPSPPQPLQGLWRRVSSPAPATSPDLAFWPIALVAQLVTTSSLWLQFTGGRLAFFSCLSPVSRGCSPSAHALGECQGPMKAKHMGEQMSSSALATRWHFPKLHDPDAPGISQKQRYQVMELRWALMEHLYKHGIWIFLLP